MSGDQDAPETNDGDLERVMREAEAAVEKVRGGRDEQDEDDEGFEVLDDPEPDFEGALVEARAENEALRDKWLRAVADLENYKKRVKRDIDDAIHRANQNLLGAFLPVGDNLERALSVAPADADEQLIKGLEMVRQEFFSALAKHGITPIETVGKPFDPNIHDALQQIDSPDFAPGMVAIEYEKGYMRGEKLLRPARVVVAGPGSTGAPPAPVEDAAN
ncbi:nucleotide exchange factor GrpE [Pseudenhygromyxa sp. WMMC2535]|uniref:nucleotide exchange factor GrpE n=1 Tax=Pseudenhygromyxa sp. WMMC2535 TaxID=2712867 RepID=UPI001552F20B|nr:nucleotide exchange factor GrpE [Pseudenhygromyxa sp. WMMC2535]NVB41183.1 nucleotide exchange factor GrpE [Pseudenhygromyxa sp. WMMC2535]